MVVVLGPGKFYGSSLPRPRFYTDVKLNDHRVDPPMSVLDPLMTWAEEAHWSMGGLSFTRHRLQGRIEGSVDKLRKQREKQFEEPASVPDSSRVVKDKSKGVVGGVRSPSPPPAPRVIKRRRVVGLVDEDEEEVKETRQAKRGPVRKLGDDFERVARESGMVREKAETVATRTRSRRTEEENNKKKRLVNKGGRKIGATVLAAGVGTRSSPRLVKAGGSS